MDEMKQARESLKRLMYMLQYPGTSDPYAILLDLCMALVPYEAGDPLYRASLIRDAADELVQGMEKSDT